MECASPWGIAMKMDCMHMRGVLNKSSMSYYSDLSHTCMHVCDNGMERLGACQGIVAMHSFEYKLARLHSSMLF
jgi:hypothetical protein